MIPSEETALVGAGARTTLILGADADDTVGEHRAVRGEGLTPRERLAVLVVGGAFLVAVAGLLVLVTPQRSVGLAVVALYVLVYALVSRIEFEIFTGFSVPTQVVLVPMLFVLPLRLVPIAVLAALTLGSLVDCLRGRIAVERIALNLASSWHAVGPVVVLAATGNQAFAWTSIPVYVAALAAQFLCEHAAVAAQERIAHGVRYRGVLPHVARAQVVDAALAPVGLAFAVAAQSDPYTLVLVLPLVWLLHVFARERHARIDNALELSAAYRGTAFLLGDVVEADDAYTGLHSRDVVELSVAVANRLRLSSAELRQTELVALLHDVGKIRIPPEIINKPGKLDPDERALMETHTIEGERMLDQVGGLLGEIGHVVRSCHERWDGNGYPDGLAGDEIPLVARIVMCCDAFSAMTTDRPYRRGLALETALAELQVNAGTQFDPRVVEALVAVIGEDVLQRPLASC